MNQILAEPHLLLTASEVAETLNISERHLHSITAPRGDLPSVRIGRSVRYSVDTLRQWIAKRQAEPGEDTAGFVSKIRIQRAGK